MPSQKLGSSVGNFLLWTTEINCLESPRQRMARAATKQHQPSDLPQHCDCLVWICCKPASGLLVFLTARGYFCDRNRHEQAQGSEARRIRRSSNDRAKHSLRMRTLANWQ